VFEISPEEAMEGIAWKKEVIMQEIAEQRKNPREGAISYLIHNDSVRSAGLPLTDEEIFGVVNLFLAGGIDTTQATLSVAWYLLDNNPEIRQLLIDKPESRTLALEEFFRYASPQQTLARRATADCVIGGQQIRKGDQVMLPWAAGNWDDSVYESPEKFIADRSPNPHMTFGVGVHRCLGSNVARVMFNACMDEVLSRIPDYKVQKELVRKGNSCGIVYAFTHLPVTFAPRKAL
jgi:cytochrome P450